MKPLSLAKVLPVTIFLLLITACDYVVIEDISHPLPVHEKDKKPDTPVQLGCIRAYFGDYYKTFSQQIEKVQPVDSFSNCYFFGGCDSTLNQINLIRGDSEYILAIYIIGYPLNSIPTALPVKSEYGKYTEIQFYSFNSYSWGMSGHYSLAAFYGQSVLITDIKDDILTGTFQGTLRSSTGEVTPVTEGEFKIRIFRKYMSCGKDSVQ
jgi:hypothetical protein